MYALKAKFRLLTILSVLFCIGTTAIGQKKNTENNNIHIVTPDKDGRLGVDAQTARLCKPGDIIYLRGKFTSIWIEGLIGTPEKPIRISNYPSETVVIGNPSWNGGSYGEGMHLINCHYFILGGDKDASEFILDGSVKEGRYAYFNLALKPFTDNAEIKNITIRNGGMGIMAKTDPEINDPKTWGANTQLNNLSIHNVRIIGTSEEGMYIGHTAEVWGWTDKGEQFNATDVTERNPRYKYVQPIMWNNVKIYDNYLEGTGNDGIQTAAINGLEIYGNEVYKWGSNKVAYHSGGILVGGRTVNSNTHDNYVHDGYGEMYQFFGSGEGNTTHICNNNLLVGTTSNGMGIYGGANVQITNNTIARTDGYSMRINGRDIKRTGDHIISNNVFIESLLKNRSFFEKDGYIRTENGATVKETGNLRFDSVKKAKVNPDNFYQPLPDATIGNAGYKKR